jgi:hypothetical protein
MWGLLGREALKHLVRLDRMKEQNSLDEDRDTKTEAADDD